jgi:hypothetical protein
VNSFNFTYCVGDIVSVRIENDPHGTTGQVVEVYNNYWSCANDVLKYSDYTPEEWLEIRNKNYSEEQLNNTQWCKVGLFAEDNLALMCCANELYFEEPMDLSYILS